MTNKLELERATPEDWLQLKIDISNEAASLGIDKIGFAAADPFLELKEKLYRHRELGHESGFEAPDIEQRTHPEQLHDEPRSIISIAVAYPSKLTNPPRSEMGAYRGLISRSAWGEDYHHVLRNRLERLEHYLRERVEGVIVRSMVDTGELVDRAVAERAGIGWSGKNCATITPEWGSWVYLGEMITNLPFAADKPITDMCGDCTLCIDACPTGALVGPGQLNSSRCVSFVTQTKGIVSDELKDKIGNRLYGCDTCQIVCPHNKGKHWAHQPELQPDPELVKPLLLPLLEMGNKEFKERYGRSAASWRGKKPIQRNAVIGLGNFKDRSAVPALAKLLADDPRPELRETAAWALGKIGGEEAKDVVLAASKRETEPVVIEALGKAMTRLAGSHIAQDKKDG